MRIYLDAKTTGLDPEKDEIIQIAIGDENGKELMASYVRPSRAVEWPESQRAGGISPEDVAGAPTIFEIASRIQVGRHHRSLRRAHHRHHGGVRRRVGRG